jgi:biopolymer transport protein ExbD
MPVRTSAFRRRRLSLTSLIDVIFLLLLFFMLSSTFSKHGEIPFLAATQGAAPATAEPPLFLRLDGDGLSLNGVALDLARLPEAIRAQSGGNPAPRVIVAVTGTATAQALVDVLAPLARIDGLQVTVVD